MCFSTTTGCSAPNITVKEILCGTSNVLSPRMAGLLYLLFQLYFIWGAGMGGFIAVQSLVHMRQPTKTVSVGCLATAFKECYLLSETQAVISFLLKQKHKRRKKLDQEKRKKVITSPANSVNGSIIHTQW